MITVFFLQFILHGGFHKGFQKGGETYHKWINNIYLKLYGESSKYFTQCVLEFSHRQNFATCYRILWMVNTFTKYLHNQLKDRLNAEHRRKCDLHSNQFISCSENHVSTTDIFILLQWWNSQFFLYRHILMLDSLDFPTFKLRISWCVGVLWHFSVFCHQSLAKNRRVFSVFYRAKRKIFTKDLAEQVTQRKRDNLPSD